MREKREKVFFRISGRHDWTERIFRGGKFVEKFKGGILGSRSMMNLEKQKIDVKEFILKMITLEV